MVVVFSSLLVVLIIVILILVCRFGLRLRVVCGLVGVVSSRLCRLCVNMLIVLFLVLLWSLLNRLVFRWV